MRVLLLWVLCATAAVAQLQITTNGVPAATQYQSYSASLSAAGGTPPYTWSVVAATGVSLPEGMSLDPAKGVVSATQVNGQGGYAVTLQVTDSATPRANTATAVLSFGVNSDTGLGGCPAFPADSIYNQRADQLPVDQAASHQIPSAYLTSPLTPDFGHGFYPGPGGIPWMRVPANQAATNVVLAGSSQIDAAGTYKWPFPAWPNAVVQGTAYGVVNDDHHVLILQTGTCNLYETYQSTAVPSMFNAASNTWSMYAGAHYSLFSDQIAASTGTLDSGGQDSPGIPILPLLLRYSEVPLGVAHPLRIRMPSPTNGWVWPATGCCGASGPPEGLLYRLKASVNWQAVCPVSSNPQAATILQALQQYGAYMSDHGPAGYIAGTPDVRWNDADLACIKNFPLSSLEVVDNSALEVSSISGQTQPYVVSATLPGGTVGTAYSVNLSAVGGNPTARNWTLKTGTIPPGLQLNTTGGAIAGTPSSILGSPYTFTLIATDTVSGYASLPQTFSIAVVASNTPVPDLTIAKVHTGQYAPGSSDTYTITVGNIGTGPTSGTVTVTEAPPAQLTVASMSGTGWTCAAGGLTCTRADVLASGSSYPPIAVAVNVAASAPASVLNTATVSGGGEANTTNDSSSVSSSPFQIQTTSVPVATQYQSYSTTLAAIGGLPPYRWSVPSSSVSLPEGMSLDPATGIVSATQVNGQGGYGVTVTATDSSLPTPQVTTATINFGVYSDNGLGGCTFFPADSIYNQRADLLPVDSTPAHQIPSGSLSAVIHPDFGHGFYPRPGGIPWMRVPANQPATNVNLAFGAQIDPAGTYQWPFPAWPNAVVEGSSNGVAGDDHHILILQTGTCTLYETYQSTSVPGMWNAANSTWLMLAGLHYDLSSNEIAASTDTLDNGAQDSPGIPIVPLLLRYSEVPLGAQHPLRITFPSPTYGWVWPATGCCYDSGPPQGLLYRLKASVNWRATCPVDKYPQAATVLQALQHYGAYMSDHGSSNYIQGVPDVRWDDLDLACIKQLHGSDLEVVDNSSLAVSPISGQTQPYVAPATLPGGLTGVAYGASLSAVGGNPARRKWAVTNGSLPPGLALNPATGTISGAPTSLAGSPYSFSVTATDTASGYASKAQAFSIAVTAASTSAVVVSSLTNSASGDGGAIAAGEMVTFKGTFPGAATAVFSVPLTTSLSGVHVLFSTFPATILYASTTQINAIVPWEVAGLSQVTVQLQVGSAASASLTVPVVDAAPGVFTMGSTGSGAAVAFNLDGSLNSPANPATAGSYVSVYFNGGGVTYPSGVDASVSSAAVSLLQNVTATVGNVPALVSYAGTAPGFVNGVNQLNLQIAAGTPTGDAVPLVLVVNGRAGAATATLSVH